MLLKVLSIIYIIIQILGAGMVYKEYGFCSSKEDKQTIAIYIGWILSYFPFYGMAWNIW